MINHDKIMKNHQKYPILRDFAPVLWKRLILPLKSEKTSNCPVFIAKSRKSPLKNVSKTVFFHKSRPDFGVFPAVLGVFSQKKGSGPLETSEKSGRKSCFLRFFPKKCL